MTPTPPAVLVRRVDPTPGRTDDAGTAIERRLCGEQWEWGEAIPQLLRVLQDPDGGHDLVRAPGRGDDEHGTATRYWSALLHLLVFHLGWLHPERGLASWMAQPQDVSDARLQVIRDIYAADGQLDWLLAWLHSGMLAPVTDRLALLVGFTVDDEDTQADQRWLDEQRRAAEASGVPNPLTGGTDRLHLAAHLDGPIGPSPTDGHLVVGDAARRRAVLLLDSMESWYRLLVERGGDLPDIGERSWRVEVVVRPVGSLGVFRRSRRSGLWFQGRHRTHLLGL